MTAWLPTVRNLVSSRNGQAPSVWAWQERASNYDRWRAYYDNSVYHRTADGGYKDEINEDAGAARTDALYGAYNPVAAVVDLYQHVFAGEFGKDITAENAPHLVDSLERIWKWSNLNIEKQVICEDAALFGCVGLRIVVRDHEDERKKRVYIRANHPATIRDIVLDERGNCEIVEVEYTHRLGIAEEAEDITIRERLTAQTLYSWRVSSGTPIPFDLFAMEEAAAAGATVKQQIQAGDTGERSAYDNPIGVTPYVLLRHDYDGTTWGRNAFAGALTPIDRLNALYADIGRNVHKHLKTPLLLAASGAAPKEFDFGDDVIIYVDTSKGGNSGNPYAKDLIISLDFAGALAIVVDLRQQIEDRMPELKAVGGRFLAGQSGETIAELRKPAIDALTRARVQYEDALVRACQIALTGMAVLSLAPEIGNSIESADDAFWEGRLDFTFNDRPFLGESDTSTQQQPGALASNANAQKRRTVGLAATNGTTQPTTQGNDATSRAAAIAATLTQ